MFPFLKYGAGGQGVPQIGPPPVSIGRQHSVTDFKGHYFDGMIDEVQIWNVARTASQIAVFKDFQVDPSTPGLVAYWRLDEGSGDVGFDLTSNGHDMQLGEAAGADAGDPTWVTPGMP